MAEQARDAHFGQRIGKRDNMCFRDDSTVESGDKDFLCSVSAPLRWMPAWGGRNHSRSRVHTHGKARGTLARKLPTGGAHTNRST